MAHNSHISFFVSELNNIPIDELKRVSSLPMALFFDLAGKNSNSPLITMDLIRLLEKNFSCDGEFCEYSLEFLKINMDKLFAEMVDSTQGLKPEQLDQFIMEGIDLLTLRKVLQNDAEEYLHSLATFAESIADFQQYRITINENQRKMMKQKAALIRNALK